MDLICINCGSSREKGRRYCKPCHKERACAQAKERYKNSGGRRTMYTHICKACSAEYTVTRKSSKLCSGCRSWRKRGQVAKNPYTYSKDYKKGLWEHRCIAEEVLGRKLNSNEVVHHMNHKHTDNVLDNLLVISRSKHSSLHYYLDEQRVIIEKSMNENSENCWNTLIVPMTTAWLETTGAKVIKLWEIGQSAAEPL